MITDEVIKEIYKKYKKPPKSPDELNLDYFLNLLSEHHNVTVDDEEVIIKDLDEFSPFRMFLLRSLFGIIEFDTLIAFIFRSHILFFGKENNEMRVHIKPENKPSIIDRVFRRKQKEL